MILFANYAENLPVCYIGLEVFTNWEKPVIGEALISREEKIGKLTLKVATMAGTYAVTGPLAHLFTGLYFADYVLPKSVFSFPLKFLSSTEALPFKTVYPLAEFSSVFGQKAEHPVKKEESYLNCSYADQ